MPLVSFENLSDASRVWVFAAEPSLREPLAERLLAIVDGFLATWAAHGQPLTCGRDWRDSRFLIVGVDQNSSHASGCSIDGLYRKILEFEQETGASLLSRDRVFYRDADGEVLSASRDEFAALSSEGRIDAGTRVFDTSLSSLGEWRRRFELPASSSWHRALLTV